MQRKLLPLEKAAVNDAGEFSGYANVFNVVDHGGDVTMPGAFAKALPEFLRDGFLAWGHDWNDPVAMPMEAHEDEHGLFIKGRFHSTPRAQEARTIATERLNAGLTMGLSIGYAVEVGTVNKTGGLDLHTIYPLWETSLVTVPMNQASYITAVKSADAAGLPESVNRITDDVPAIVARFQKMADLRAQEGRALSPSNRALVKELMDSLIGSSSTLRDLLDATEPEKDRLARDLEKRARLASLGILLG
jgi:HK97 family phage prohead protease